MTWYELRWENSVFIIQKVLKCKRFFWHETDCSVNGNRFVRIKQPIYKCKRFVKIVGIMGKACWQTVDPLKLHLHLTPLMPGLKNKLFQVIDDKRLTTVLFSPAVVFVEKHTLLK